MAALPACSEGVHLAINSLAMYAAPRVKLLGELRAAGVPMHQVHVFLGDSPTSDDGAAWCGRGRGGARRDERRDHERDDPTQEVAVL